MVCDDERPFVPTESALDDLEDRPVEIRTAYVYILLRRDLDHNQALIQHGHAIQESSYLYPKSEWSQDPDDETNHVLLAVENEEELVAAKHRLDAKGIRTYIFYEPAGNLGYSALASEPLISKQKRKAFFIYPKYVSPHGVVAQAQSSP